ncbi:antibiotic biosynthesis monooxygenase (plasmid) [Ensifer adhaerens]|nr:antibiotic biosynthesis monooxygenase [Ensifer adhaerens]THA60246.1 antibiotic biosynthesis monooxygenase [Ensifer adhaerens]
MANVHILAILYSKPGKEEDLRRDLTTICNASSREDGNIRYELHEDANDQRRFVIIEQWNDAAAQEKHHNQSNHIRLFHDNGDRNVERREIVCFLKPVA